MKTLKALKRELLNDAKTRAAYDTLADEYAIAHQLIAARARAGLSQSEVAQRMTQREVLGRYKGSFMGLAWSFFTPLLMLAVDIWFQKTKGVC